MLCSKSMDNYDQIENLPSDDHHLPFSEKLYNYLQKNPESCDVTFLVGPNKEKIRTAKLILLASTSEFRKLIRKSDQASTSSSLIGVNDPDLQGQGVSDPSEKGAIELPQYDPEAFKIFLKLLPSDNIADSEAFKGLELENEQIFDLIDISKMFGMKSMEIAFQKLNKGFFEKTNEFLKSPEFYNLSKKDLEMMFSSDWISLDEVQLFKSAARWAENQITELQLESTPENKRRVLGGSLFEIRFPLMSINDFSKYVCPTNILTDNEKLQIFEYLATDAKDRKPMDQFRFKTTKRLGESREPMGNLAGLITASQTSNQPFVCDFQIHNNYFHVDKKIILYSVGFLGPLYEDSFYDVRLQIRNHTGIRNYMRVKCKVFAKKRQVFHVRLSPPLVLEANSAIFNDGMHYYQILYALQGPDTLSANTSGVSRTYAVSENHKFKVDDVGFCFQHFSRQVAELRFSRA